MTPYNQASQTIAPKAGMRLENTNTPQTGQPITYANNPVIPQVAATGQHLNQNMNVLNTKKDHKKAPNKDYNDGRQQDRNDRSDRDSGWDANRDSRDNYRDSKYESRGNKKYNSKKRSSSSTSRGKRRDDKPYLDKRVN